LSRLSYFKLLDWLTKSMMHYRCRNYIKRYQKLLFKGYRHICKDAVASFYRFPGGLRRKIAEPQDDHVELSFSYW
jgi:hypothetical protein